jgi:hypothetical protein
LGLAVIELGEDFDYLLDLFSPTDCRQRYKVAALQRAKKV